MSFVNRFWRFFRLGLLVIAFIGIAFYLLLSTRWDKIFGHEPTYAHMITDGQPIVTAIYKFKAQRGLWPEYLDELSPEFLTPEASRKADIKWHYEVERDGRPGLSGPTEYRRTHVGFDFDPERPSWLVFGDEDNRVLKAMTPESASGGAIGGPTLPAGKLVENKLAELDKRIGRAGRMMRSEGGLITLTPSPSRMEYRRGKVSLLVSLGRMEEARAAIEEARAASPDHFWPRLARVKMDLDARASATAPGAATRAATGTLTESLVDFYAWVRMHPSFTNWYYLSLSYRWAGRNADAIASVEEALKLPATPSDEDTEVTAFYFWDMARYALQQEKWDLALETTAAWAGMQTDGRKKIEYSYLALAAAAKLARGDVAGAQADMETLRSWRKATWAQNLDSLEAAIKRGDAAFRYDPGNKPPSYEVFAVPE